VDHGFVAKFNSLEDAEDWALNNINVVSGLFEQHLNVQFNVSRFLIRAIATTESWNLACESSLLLSLGFFFFFESISKVHSITACGSVDDTLSQLESWASQQQDDVALWHQRTNCHPGPGTHPAIGVETLC
jgi:hypothetical protein